MILCFVALQRDADLFMCIGLIVFNPKMTIFIQTNREIKK